MRSLRAIYENGQIIFPGGSAPQGKSIVIITFLDDDSSESGRRKDPGKRFVSKWRGVIRGRNVDDWKDQKAEYLKGKPG